MRDATTDDTEAIASLWTSAFVTSGQVPRAEPFTADETAPFVAAGQGRIAATEDGTVVGVVVLLPPGAPGAFIAEGQDERVLFRLAVDPSARGQGIGGALIDWCIEESRASGAAKLWLWSRETQADAHRLYKRAGFLRTPARDADSGGSGRLVFLRDI
ncbi:MAG: GNAT family N-acetyltransferase [Solirubrobacterales bacterium]